MKIKCCIIEDEEPAVELLSFFIKQSAQLELKKVFHNNMNLPIEVLDGSHLLFLDIEMPFRTGIEFLRAQQLQRKVPVILTTSHSQHGIEAFDLSVLDYLVKPFSKKRFDEAVSKACDYFVALQTTRNEKFIWVSDDYKKVKIASSAILFIESVKQYVKIHTREKRYMVIQTLKSLEKELADTSFVRCHKSFLINRSFVKSFNKSVVLINETEIPIGKQYLEATIKKLQ